VPTALLKKIEDVSVDQQRLQQQIVRYMQSKKDVESVFSRVKQRLFELLEGN
jgi:hypothetical protein